MEVVTTDAAANEILATHITAGKRSPKIEQNDAQQPLMPNIKLVGRDQAHAFRRLMTRPYKCHVGGRQGLHGSEDSQQFRPKKDLSGRDRGTERSLLESSGQEPASGQAPIRVAGHTAGPTVALPSSISEGVPKDRSQSQRSRWVREGSATLPWRADVWALNPKSYDPLTRGALSVAWTLNPKPLKILSPKV